jgi:hypothetical protein
VRIHSQFCKGCTTEKANQFTTSVVEPGRALALSVKSGFVPRQALCPSADAA